MIPAFKELTFWRYWAFSIIVLSTIIKALCGYNSIPAIVPSPSLCVHVYLYFISPKDKKFSEGTFCMLDTNSGSRSDLELFIVIISPSSLPVPMFASRNINVFDYRVLPQTLLRVLLTVEFLYLDMFLNVKNSEFQNSFGPVGFEYRLLFKKLIN